MAMTSLSNLQWTGDFKTGANDIDLLIPNYTIGDGGNNMVQSKSFGSWQFDDVMYHRVNTNSITIQIFIEFNDILFKIKEVLNFVGIDWYFQLNKELTSEFRVRIKTIGAAAGEIHSMIAFHK